ncbi:MAG: ribonuclease P protein component [Coriobacteriia bacterium]|nr:ribonuclease P protein component [Coriobacteriia bacterium]
MDEVLRAGARVSHPLVIALIRETPPGRGPEGRVAFVAGKKLGNAVKRNRSKRVLRAAVARAGGPWPGADVVFIARPTTATAPPGRLDEALGVVARRIGAH